MELLYGKKTVTFDLPREWEPDLFRPNPIPPAEDPIRELIQSLDNPYGKRRLEHFSGVTSVAIAVSDETRPVPNDLVLPLLLKRLHQMGISKSAIRIFVAPGLHCPTPESRLANILPSDIINHYFITVHDAFHSDLKFLGRTARSTPVFVNPLFFGAELRLVIGMINPHQFVGYTGGVKGAAIGLAGAETIEANHSMLFHPQALIGEIQGNPVRQDIEEIGKMMGVHFAIDVVLDESNRIIKAFSGEPSEVERAGSEFCRKVYEVKTLKEYDIVMVSAGGYPKDINLYQAQKALAAATPLVRKGGEIILFAECSEGHGDEVFYRTIKRYKSPQEVVESFQKERFRMGVHKAFLWTRSLTKAQVYLRSTLEKAVVHELMVLPANNIEELLLRINNQYARPPQIAILPRGNSTYVKRVHDFKLAHPHF
jgi:nickel-dependent lactate racemase